jgi:hypothetical protein
MNPLLLINNNDTALSLCISAFQNAHTQWNALLTYYGNAVRSVLTSVILQNSQRNLCTLEYKMGSKVNSDNTQSIHLRMNVAFITRTLAELPAPNPMTISISLEDANDIC